MLNKSLLLVMTKSPEQGKVKTRMQSRLSQQQCVDLHIALTRYALFQWAEANIGAIELWVGGNIELCHQQLSLDQHFPALPVYPQSSGDLGERMLYAVSQHCLPSGASSTQSVILVGTDCPWITEDYLNQAANGLLEHDVVIGPAKDGGYVLLAMKNCHIGLFEDIEWGSDRVFSQTMSKVATLGLSCLQLEALSDIDIPRDLALLSNQQFPKYLDQFSIFSTTPLS